MDLMDREELDPEVIEEAKKQSNGGPPTVLIPRSFKRHDLNVRIVGLTPLLTDNIPPETWEVLWAAQSKEPNKELEKWLAKRTPFEVFADCLYALNAAGEPTDKAGNLIMARSAIARDANDKSLERWSEQAKKLRWGFPAHGVRKAVVKAGANDRESWRDTEARLFGRVQAPAGYFPIEGAAPRMVRMMARNKRGNLVAVVRAMFMPWEMDVTLSYPYPIIRQDEVLRLVEAAGTKVGIGVGRPERGLTYGQFTVHQPEPPQKKGRGGKK